MSRQEAFTRLAPIALRIAGKYKNRLPVHLRTDDLANVALMGVWEAVSRHYGDETKSLAAQAIVRAEGAVLDYLRTSDWASRRVRRMGLPYTMLAIDALEVEFSTHTPSSLVEVTTPEDHAIESQASRKKRAALESALLTLPARSRYIMRKVMAGVTYLAIAKDLGVSEPRITQLVAKSTAAIKQYFKTTSWTTELW